MRLFGLCLKKKKFACLQVRLTVCNAVKVNHSHKVSEQVSYERLC